MIRLMHAGHAGRFSPRAASRRRCAPATPRRTSPRRWGGAIRGRELSGVENYWLRVDGWQLKQRRRPFEQAMTAAEKRSRNLQRLPGFVSLVLVSPDRMAER